MSLAAELLLRRENVIKYNIRENKENVKRFVVAKKSNPLENFIIRYLQ